MDYGNGGPANRVAQGFEHISDSVDFNPERLQDPNQKEQDPTGNLEGMNNPGEDGGYINPGMLGGATVQAAQFGGQMSPLGEVVSEGEVGMRELTESQVIGTDINVSKFEKNGITKELEERLDAIKKEPNLYKQSIDFVLESKKSLSSSFADRGYLSSGGDK